MILGKDAASLNLAVDAQGVDTLRQQARSDPRGAIRETARQFESLLLNVMIKSMRDTVGQDGMFDSEQTKLYTSLLDQQLSQAMSRRGIGIADALVKQLSPALGTDTSSQGAAVAQTPAARVAAAGGSGFAPAPSVPGNTQGLKNDVKSFIERLGPQAEAASRETGIPARFMVGHAALETGWGRHEIRGADGAQSFNLFGIKAGADWKGGTVDTMTTEYVDGVARKKVETFRAYDSYQDAFRDYANLLQTRPRYAEVLKNTHDAKAYARELQEAGYATDPGYAQKLAGVIDGRLLRLAMTA
jgi:peptidoglycan hydrolase FlgJ